MHLEQVRLVDRVGELVRCPCGSGSMAYGLRCRVWGTVRAIGGTDVMVEGYRASYLPWKRLGRLMLRWWNRYDEDTAARDAENVLSIEQQFAVGLNDTESAGHAGYNQWVDRDYMYFDTPSIDWDWWFAAMNFSEACPSHFAVACDSARFQMFCHSSEHTLRLSRFFARLHARSLPLEQLPFPEPT